MMTVRPQLPRIQPALSVTANDRVVIRRGSSVDVLSAADIVSVHSARNVTRLVTRDSEICVYMAFGQVVESLRAFGVLRIHRGIGVSTTCIRRVVGRGQHRVFVVLDGGKELPVGRGYQPALRASMFGVAPTHSEPKPP